MKTKKILFMTLPALSAVGLVATAVLSAKGSVKTERCIKEKEANGENIDTLERIKIGLKCYAPAIAVGIASLLCIFETGVVNKNQQLALAGTCTLAQNKFREYKAKVIDIYGEEAHKRIIEELAVEPCEERHIEALGLIENSCLDFNNGVVEDEKHIFYDEYGDRHFESTFERVLQAEYHLNRNFALGGAVTLNDFYDFLGLEATDAGEAVGWSVDTGLMWIDFNHRSVNMDNGETLYIIETPFEPDLL